MKDKSEFFIIFDGSALQSNEMNVRELSPALLAIGDVLEQANHIINGDKNKIDVKIKGFQSGSFGVEFAVSQGYISQVLDLFNKPLVTGTINLLTLLGFVGGSYVGLLKLIKWVKNRKIDHVKTLENGAVKIFISDEFIEVSLDVLNLYRDYKLRDALSGAIYKPLTHEGIESIAIKSSRTEKNDFFVINQSEKDWFNFTPSEEIDQEIEVKTDIETLQIVNASFRENNKWKFTDGQTAFFADITDPHFLNAIAKNEKPLYKDDIFKVEIKKKKWLDNENKMRASYEILKVLDHKSAAKQLNLTFTD